MTSFLQLAFILAILLFCAKAAGYLTTKIGQPSVLGELLVGVILGPSLINIINFPFVTNHEVGVFIKDLGEIGVLLLMFMAGLELHLNELTKNKRASILAGTFGVILPILFGYGIGVFYNYNFSQSMFLGLTLGATSVSISAQTLIELKALRSRVGLGLLGAAVIDDMLVILALSTFLALESGGNAIQVLFVFFKMIAFLVGSIAFGLWVLPRISRYVSKLPISQGLVTLSIIIMLVYGVAAEVFGGMAAITGSFIAGLMFSRTREKAEIERGLRSVAYSFFVPLFFVNIGLSVNIRELKINALWIMLIISIAAILGKLIGSGLGAKLGSFSWRESVQLGIGMISRGEVGLIVAAVGLEAGLISPDLFSSIIGMVLITTLVTPPLLRASFSKPVVPLQPPANAA